MARFRQILKKLLFPGRAAVLLCVPAAAALLAVVFLRGLQESPLAYASYVFSFYTLVILCAAVFRQPRHGLRDLLHRSPLVHRYLTDIPFKTHVSLYWSFGINLLFAAMKLFYSVRYRSVWFATLAVYYILLALMRFLLLRHAGRSGIGRDPVAELRQYRLCGGILLGMNIALLGVVILVVREGASYHYAGYLIYVVALYAFYNIITAVRDNIRYRRYKSPLMSAAKAIKLAAALVSMLALETAMLDQFGAGREPGFRRLMTGLTGSFVCLTVLVMALAMLVRSTRRLRQLRDTAGPRA